MTQSSSSGGALTTIVCIKFTVDVNQLQTDPSTGRPNLERAVYRISNFDENAIEEAVKLKERHGGQVVAISVVDKAPPRDVTLKALAMGVDSLYFVQTGAATSGGPAFTASVLAAVIQTLISTHKLDRWNLILCGDGSVDEYNGQVGPRIAEALGIPAITYVTKLEVDGGSLRADRSAEEIGETVEAPLPALVTVGMETNQPRMPTVLQIMGAGRKPVVEIAMSEIARPALLQPETGPLIKTEDIYAPPSTRKRIVIQGESTDEIVRTLLRHLGAAGEVRF